MFREFETIKEITDYLISPHDKPLYAVANNDLGSYVLPLIASELTEIPENMMLAMTIYAVETNSNIRDVVLPVFEKLHATKLSIYKFCIMCGMRGPLNLETLEKYVIEHITVERIAIIARHPHFPVNLRKAFYDHTGEIEYLPQEAQDIFVF